MFTVHCRVLMLLLALSGGWFASPTHGQTLNLPARATNALTGSQFANIVWLSPRDNREAWIYGQIVSGNVPNWLRTLKPINTSSGGHTGTYYVTPDYMAIGSDDDYFLIPMSPLLAQRLCDRFGYTLPTRKMVDQIWAASTVKMTPDPIPASGLMTTVPVFVDHNNMVRADRNTFTNSQPLGALVGGNKKDVISSGLIYTNFVNAPTITKVVVIYGWHYPGGSHIQNAYNGHEETYADYSHGIRFVQMNMTVDGGTASITNVLTDPTLAGLLSDDATYSASFTIPKPRYTIGTLTPVVLNQPRSRSVLRGETATFNVFATGDASLGYRWLFNGTTLPGATNTMLTVTDIQSTNAGNYSVIVTNQSGSITSRVAVLRLKMSNFPALFADDFDTDTSTNWNIFWVASDGIPDYTVDFAFDYRLTSHIFNGTTALIPPAPNSPDGSTRAVKLTVNNNDANAATAAVNLYPKNFSASGNYALKFDLWMQYPGTAGGLVSTGSTVYAQCGINHFGTNVNWSLTNATTASDGLWFAVDGEGGVAADYRAYRGVPNGPPVDLTGNLALSGLVATNNTATVFQTLFPASRFETTGSPGKNWVEVELRQFNNNLTWLMNGTVVAQRTNASGFTNGNIMIGLMDPFNSIANAARECFVLFDNVRVENLAPPIQFQTISSLPDGNMALTVSSALGDSFWIDSSTNLTVWQPLANVNMTNNLLTFVDTNANARATTFYRARR